MDDDTEEKVRSRVRQVRQKIRNHEGIAEDHPAVSKIRQVACAMKANYLVR